MIDLRLRGEACDIGLNSNPTLTRQEAERCFERCFPNGYGQEERNPPKTPGTHIHIQEHPVESGRPGFTPDIQPYRP